MGTRLREVVADRPKVLAEVNGRPFLSFLLDRLADEDFQRVVLCTGHMAQMVHDTFGDRYRDMDLLYSREESPLGTGGALRLALPLINSDPVLVMNGDSFCDVDLGLFARQHAAASTIGSLVLVQVKNIARYGAVDIDESGRVVSFMEKGSKNGKGVINAGIYLLARKIIETIHPGRTVSLEQEVFPRLIGEGLSGFLHPSRFIDIGIPSDYHAVSAFLDVD